MSIKIKKKINWKRFFANKEKLNEIYKRQIKKSRQDAKITYQRLKKSGYMVRFRNVWGLPPDGFLSKNSYQKWQNEVLIKRTNNVLCSKEYKQR